MKCPVCGISLDKLSETDGRLGCPHDYNVFRDLLMEPIESLQFDTRHTGKRPSRHAFLHKRDTIIRHMKRAIKNEDYEKASRLKSELDKLQESTG